MTIQEAINLTDFLKPNSYSRTDKVRWLSDLDSTLWENVISGHQGWEGEKFSGYDQDTPDSRELLAPSPYDEMYLRWLEAKIDYSNGEMNRYNNSILLYNTLYKAFDRHYNRKFLPTGKNYRYF